MESEQYQMSTYQLPNLASRQLTQEDLPASKIDQDTSVVSAGVSEEGAIKSEDSNHEPMISASSNHKLTPSQHNNLSHN